MKSIQDLQAVRERALAAIQMDGKPENMRVVVGLATCGIAAGALPVFDEIKKQVKDKGLTHVSVVQTGCIGMCRYEPMVEITQPGKEKVTYVRVKSEMVSRIVDEHLAGGKPVLELTIQAAEAK